MILNDPKEGSLVRLLLRPNKPQLCEVHQLWGLSWACWKCGVPPSGSRGQPRYTQTLLAVRLSGAHCSARLVAWKATRHSLQLFLTVAGKMLGLFAVAKNKTQQN